MFDNIFDLKYGVAGVCVLLTIMVLIQVGKFVWTVKQEKDKLSDDTVADLVKAVEKLEHTVSDLPKFRTDVRRFYTAIKVIAGDKWPQVRDEIMKDDFIG